MRKASPLLAILGLALSAACFAQAAPAPAAPLPDAPSATKSTPSVPPATAYMVNGRPYRQPTAGDRGRIYVHDLFGVSQFFGTGIRSAISFGQDRPDGWGQDFPGYLQRYGSSYGEHGINATTRYVLASAFHEDLHYILCHKCSKGDKIKNAIKAEYTARHGADGHRKFSITPIAGSIPGAFVSRNVWYPPSTNAGNPTTRIFTGIGTRIGLRIVREFFFDREAKKKRGTPPAPATSPTAYSTPSPAPAQ